MQVVQPGLARLMVMAAAGATGFRVFAGRTALVVFRRDSLVSADVMMLPIGPDWWTAIP